MAFSLIEVKKSIMITDNFWAQAAIIINLSTMSTISATIGLSNDTMMWELVSEHFSEFLCLLLSVYPLSDHLSHFPLFIWHWWKRNEQDADLLHHTLPQISYMQLHLTKILGHVLFLFSILKRKKSAVIFMLTALMATWCFNDSKSFTTLLLKWNFLSFHVQKPLSYFIIGMTKPITIEFFLWIGQSTWVVIWSSQNLASLMMLKCLYPQLGVEVDITYHSCTWHSYTNPGLPVLFICMTSKLIST